jgi:hypothetical protein
MQTSFSIILIIIIIINNSSHQTIRLAERVTQDYKAREHSE